MWPSNIINHIFVAEIISETKSTKMKNAKLIQIQLY